MGLRERKNREKELRREEIIKAGEKLFLKKGFISTTMDEIARECELSKGTLYLYFSSKEELFSTIVLMAMTEMLDMMKKSQTGLSNPLERISMIGEAYLGFYESHPEYFRILARTIDFEFDPKESSFEVGMKIQVVHNEVWMLMTGIINDGIKEGLFLEGTDPVEICISLYASSTMIIQLMDHAVRNEHNFKTVFNKSQRHKYGEMPFAESDFRKTLHKCGERIIFSILKNPQNMNSR